MPLFPIAMQFLAAAAAAEQPAKPIDFSRDIRPILSDHCYACHGPDEANRQAGLRLDLKDFALGKVIVPGDPAKSRIYQRMSHENKARRMPPPSFDRQPDPKQVELVKRWIEQGAQWKTHWAYETPSKQAPPVVRLKNWPKNALDNFVLARLEKEGVKPSPEAPRTTLLRRLSFDLTGLPPTLAEIDAFLADKSPDAYEKQVDRLLGSKHYGERMAMQWLDLARYADTHGYHIDSHRDMWPWRDWVIRAFNNNMPYDRFTIEQLAGDLLPNPTKDQLIATGFNRNHMINYEGGAIPEEYLVEYVADRVETTSNVWLAMTMGCARCHDHKYDPIKQADFYKFFAFFNTISEKGLDGQGGNANPVLTLPNDAQKTRFDAVKAAIAAREAELPEKQLDDMYATWEAAQQVDLAGPVSLRNGLQFHYEFEGNTLDSSGRYRHARVVSGEPGFSNSGVGRGADFNGENTQLNVGPAELSGPFTLAFWMRFNQGKEATILRKPGALEIWHEAAMAIPRLRRAARLHIELGPTHLRTKEMLIFGELKHLALIASDAGTVTLFVNGKPFALETVAAAGPISQMQSAEPIEIGAKPAKRERFKGQIDDLRLYSRAIGDGELQQLAIHQPVPALLTVAKDKRTKPQKDALRDYFLSYQAPAETREAYLDVKRLKAVKVDLDEEITTTMVMSEAEKPRDTFILARGDYRNAKDKVSPAVPAVLPPLSSTAKADRLALAQWLVQPNHPLTARVAVNRFWQQYFSIGIVKTSEDFGSQGEPPSHPELLDYLATAFVESGWDVKALQRLIVTSATYRQSSKVPLEMVERDPQNRLLARMSRFRLPAETLRDNAMAIAGLLNPEIGGRSVYPYQPAGLWEELAYGDRFSAQTYKPSHGSDLYRRSMYWFWKRTVPPATLSVFDAPDREKCTVRRAVTNTPLQALILLNDPTYVEAARTLAARALASSPDPSKRMAMAFRSATGREMSAREARVLKDLLARQLEIYAADAKGAEQLVAIGESPVDKRWKPAELAAWTTLANAILNMDEVITKE